MLPTWVYAKSADGVYVNLFIGSSITVGNVGGVDVQMVQATNYPWDGKVSITVNPKVPARFSVRVRTPDRGVSSLYKSAPDANGIASLAVNGAAVKPAIDKGYAAITRAWKAGDRIDFVLPMKIQRVRAAEQLEADRNKVALRYGPLVYNIERVDQDIAKVLSPESALTTEWKPDLLGGVVSIQGKFADGSPVMAIPNYARMNREPVLPPPAPRAGSPGVRPARRPATSIVWIEEGKAAAV
jgi:hypothetical protein